MSFILGVDTGGTYTDGVIFDTSGNDIVKKSKSLTTYDDLTRCIKTCIASLGKDHLSRIECVSLSTTLATNAIVEAKGCDTGLIIIGRTLDGALPAKVVHTIKGGHDVRGVALEDLDPVEVQDVIESMRGKVQAIAVSGYFSVRNPGHELAVMKLVRQMLNIPVVCAHQLSSSLGYYERTVTTILNAQLVPIIVDLIHSIKSVITELDIHAPLMIVKGDGALMDERTAKERPIETILSGPASSITGSTTLTACKDALVLDMGGTTTDIAVVRDGFPKVNPEGASVDGWLTRVKAVDINTYGIGGDSAIRWDKNNRLVIGPRKVVPLCVAAHIYPGLADELAELHASGQAAAKSNPVDCFMRVGDSPDNDSDSDLNEKEHEILRLLEDGPHLVTRMEHAMRKKFRFFSFDNLLAKGVIKKVSFTPTDVLHSSGAYAKWNHEASTTGAQILAETLGLSPDDFLDHVTDAITNKIARVIFQTLLDNDQSKIELNKSREAQYLIDKILSPDENHAFGITSTLRFPIVAVGAPAKAYIPAVAEKINAQIIIPDHYEVANAVGAATGKWIKKVEMLIRSDADEGLTLHAPWERKTGYDLESAKACAIQAAKDHIDSHAQKAGIKDYQITIDQKDFFIDAVEGSQGLHVETRLWITAVSSPGAMTGSEMLSHAS